MVDRLSATQRLSDELIQHGIRCERMSASLVRSIRRRVGQQAAEVLGQIDPKVRRVRVRGRRVNYSFGNVRALLGSARSALRDSMAGIKSEIAKTAEAVALSEVESVAIIISRTTGKRPKLPTAASIRRAVKQTPFFGLTMQQWLDSISDQTQAAVEREIRLGLNAGKTTNQIMIAVRNQLTKPLLNRAEAAIRTIMAGVCAAATSEITNRNRSMFSHEMWISMLDERVCAVCGGLSGQLFLVGQGPVPPDPHPNCRCRRHPVIAGEEPPMDERFPEWLRRQSLQDQNEALGPTRARLFRRGVVGFESFSKDLRPLTLKELRIREGLNPEQIDYRRFQ